MAVTAAQAISAYNANKNIAAQVVADTLANLITNIAGLQTLQAAGKMTAISLSGSNLSSAAQAQSIAGLPNFSLASGATLVVTDTAANIILAGNATGLAKATSIVLADTAANLLSSANAGAITKASSIQLTGTSNAVTAAQATTLAGLKGFAMGSGATLVVTDTAANIILAGNATGLAKATSIVLADTAANLLSSANAGAITKAASIQLTGTSNAVTASQATTLAGLKGFVMGSGATLVVTDTAANIILAGNATGLAKATSIVLADTAANLLSSANAVAIAKASSVQLTGKTNVVTAAQATTLAGLKGFAMGSGATLVVTDTAANILLAVNADGVMKATAVQLTGTSNTVNVTQAMNLANLTSVTLGASATLVLADTAVSLLSSANQPAIKMATAIQLIGDNSLTGNEANALAALKGFKLAAGATLLVSDTADKLIFNGGSTPPYRIATSVQLIGTNNILNVAEANSLAGGTVGFSMAADATLVVSDTLPKLLSSLNSVALATATSVELKANLLPVEISDSVTGAQAAVLAALKGFALGSGATLVVTDTAANLLLAGNAAGLAKATSIVLADTVANLSSSANAGAIAKASRIVVADTAANLMSSQSAEVVSKSSSVMLADTAMNLLALSNSAAIKMANSVQLVGANTVTAAQATKLASLKGFTLAPDATLNVTDGAFIQGEPMVSLQPKLDNTVVIARGGEAITNYGKNGTISYADSSAAVYVAIGWYDPKAPISNMGALLSGGDAGRDSIRGFFNAIGSQYNDTLLGNGRSILTGGGGNDYIFGKGTDTAAFWGNKSDYTIDFDAGKGSYIITDTGRGIDGVDSLWGIQYLQFFDQTYELPVSFGQARPPMQTGNYNQPTVQYELNSHLSTGPSYNRPVYTLDNANATFKFDSGSYFKASFDNGGVYANNGIIVGSTSILALSGVRGDANFIDFYSPGTQPIASAATSPTVYEISLPGAVTNNRIKSVCLPDAQSAMFAYQVGELLHLSFYLPGNGLLFDHTISLGAGAIFDNIQSLYNNYFEVDFRAPDKDSNLYISEKALIYQFTTGSNAAVRNIKITSDNQTVMAMSGETITDIGKNGTISFEASKAGVSVELNKNPTLAAVTSGGDAQGDVIKGFVNIIGSQNNDILTGIGSSLLTGGEGNDIFVYGSTSASLVSNYDTVTDFSVSDSLKIGRLISSSDFKTASGKATGDLSSDLANALSAVNFTQNCAAMVTLTGPSSDTRNFAVISNHDQAQVGFVAANDIVVKLETGAITASSFVI